MKAQLLDHLATIDRMLALVSHSARLDYQPLVDELRDRLRSSGDHQLALPDMAQEIALIAQCVAFEWAVPETAVEVVAVPRGGSPLAWWQHRRMDGSNGRRPCMKVSSRGGCSSGEYLGEHDR